MLQSANESERQLREKGGFFKKLFLNILLSPRIEEKKKLLFFFASFAKISFSEHCKNFSVKKGKKQDRSMKWPILVNFSKLTEALI